MPEYRKYTQEGRLNGERVSFNHFIDQDQFGDVAMAAYSAAVKDLPRLDIFGIGIGGSILSEIVKVGNALYFGGCDKNVYCVTEQGELLWKFPTNGLNVSPTVSNGRVYIGSFDENFYASKPCTFADRVCFGSKDGNVYCLSEDGRLVWKFRTHGPITQDPVFHKGMIYIGSDDSVLYVLDAQGGQLVRKIMSNGAFGTPVIANDIIYVGCFDKNFYAFTLDGRELWRYKHNSIIGTRRPLSYNNMIFGCSRDGNVYGITTGGKLYKKYITKELLWCTPVTDGKNLYFGSPDYNFYAFDIEAGSVVWKFPIKGLIASTATLDNGILYFGGWDSHLYAITTSGELVWKFKLNMSTPALIEPEEELVAAMQSQVVWQPEIAKEEETWAKPGEADIADYGTFSGTYIDTSKTDYLGHKKKGYKTG
jgi:outer membrane protein assembly factor BamB